MFTSVNVSYRQKSPFLKKIIILINDLPNYFPPLKTFSYELFHVTTKSFHTSSSISLALLTKKNTGGCFSVSMISKIHRYIITIMENSLLNLQSYKQKDDWHVGPIQWCTKFIQEAEEKACVYKNADKWLCVMSVGRTGWNWVNIGYF